VDALKTPDLAARVCPRCGQPASDQSFCGGCGLNLAAQAELPSDEEYDARLRQEQWLRAQAGTSMPNSARAARALPDPARVRARQATRSRLLGSAAAAVAVAFALNWIGAILHFVESFEAGGTAAPQVLYGFAVAGNLVLIPAFASAAAAFLGEPSDRATRLRRAALIAAFGFGLLMVATAIRAGVYANIGSVDFITKLVAGESLQATSELLAAIAAAMASVAFLPSRSEPAVRNWWLGLASVALGGVFLLSMVGHIVALSAGLNGGSSRLALGASGAGVGLVAAGIAAGAFLLARGPQERTGDWWSKRDGVLGIAQAVLALAFLLAAIGDAILAGESVAGKAIAGNWLEFGGDLSLLGAAITASIGFFVMGRLRRQDAVRE
jgi:hypothetical protein